MSRQYTIICDQNMYDVTVQKFAGIDDIDQVMRNVPDLNKILPFGLEITLPDTEDTLARLFDSNREYFATGQPEEVPDPVDYLILENSDGSLFENNDKNIVG